MPVKLNNGNLARLPADIQRPVYDRAGLKPGIVHIGLGNFHRAHQAWYLHQLMQTGLAHDWAIIGAGVRAYDEVQRQKLLDQDCLTTLIELDPAGKSAEIVGSMIDYLPVVEGHGPLIAKMSEAAIRIVSLTVTESGYYLDPASKEFDPSHEDIQHDIANINAPRTAFGAIIAALAIRRDRGLGPFTCQSCDNLPGNGIKLREVILGLADLLDRDLAQWIRDNVTFPNSMVDCIVPATGPRELALAESFAISDQVPVTHENFRQWVIEDQFCAGRPAWEKVGATFSDHVHDYEMMKLRMLNGGHQIIAAPGEIFGLETIAETMANPLIKRLFRKIEMQEISLHVPQVPGMAAKDYCDLLDQRFSNPAIFDTVRRVAFDGSSRQTGFILPILRDAVKMGSALDGLALSQALWARMCAGTRDNGSEIEANDPLWPDLQKASIASKNDPQIWLAQHHLYGELAKDERFSASFAKWLRQIWQEGTQKAIFTYVA